MRALGELLLSKAGYQSTDIAEAYLGRVQRLSPAGPTGFAGL